jgi:hypothetical protein
VADCMTKPPPRRAATIAALVREHRWTMGAELGVLHGYTTRHLLHACPALRLTAVDTWQHGDLVLDDGIRGAADNGHRSYADVDMEAAYRGVLDIQGQYPRRLTILRMPTWQASDLTPSASLDFVFIDADHSAEGVERDIRTWAPTVKPTGWLIGHDADYPSVASVIDRLLPWYDILPGNVWAIPMADVRL